ncbi:uncharacterized protein LOC118267748 [Spodoptera frugiperda]|uniref:Uncharacterized protein LOC118267748 n=1 Tax=Spodoptera frugiperda TaxID=7108 RepID=A0A9R0DNY0_SPOFR|nr:uncharacterized protein LOC118267748 [Spodoptera frugiperda]
MRTELPTFKRCCFCVPLRYGLLTWAYLKLVAVVLLATFLAMYLYRIIRRYNRIPYPGDLHGMAIIGVLLVILLIEFCFTVTFVIGGHMKNLKPMRVFYVYNMVMVVITLGLMMILVGLMLRDMDPSHVVSYYSWNFLLTMANFFFTLLVQIYFILLIRSEIFKLEGKYGFSFVNNAAEEECIMRGDTQIEEDWKTIEDLEENKTAPSAMQDGNEKSCEQGLRYPS